MATPKSIQSQLPEPSAGMKGQRRVFKMPPEEYRALLKGINLEEIALVSCSAGVKRERLGEPLGVAIHKDSVRILKNKGAVLSFEHSYQVTAAGPTEKNPTISIKCSFYVEYKAEQPVSKEFLEIFSRVNVPVNTWPYFREFVQNMTLRVGLPPLQRE